MAVDLKSNQNSISEAYNDVFDEKSDTDWVVFGYEGKTNVLKVVEKGGGGLEEMVDEMNSGKILYAYCKVMDDNTNLPKYVLFSWQGEGAPDELKFKCANHIRDIQKFLKCVHITVNARTDDDLDVDAIKLKVAKASGSNYSFHKEQSKPEAAPLPVGSVYQRTQAQREINIKARDRFWSQTEVDEKQRLEELEQQAQEERVILERDRKEREAKEATERDKNLQARFKHVQAQKMAERRAESIDKDAEKEKWEAEEKESTRLEESRRKRSESLRKEKAAEAANMASSRPQKAGAAKAFFEQKAAENAGLSFEPKKGPPPPRKLRHGFASQSKDDDEEHITNEPVSSPIREPTSPPSYPAREPSPEPDNWQPEVAPEPEPSQLPRSPLAHPEPYTYSQSAEPTSPSAQAPQTPNLLKESMPRRPPSDSEEEEDVQTWEEDPSEKINIPAVISPEHQPDSVYEQEEVQTSPVSNKSSGVRAIALYDYQAADDTEITFDPDDILTDIDQIDPGWWIGTGPDGSRGMFPANYVEIMN